VSPPGCTSGSTWTGSPRSWVTYRMIRENGDGSRHPRAVGRTTLCLQTRMRQSRILVCRIPANWIGAIRQTSLRQPRRLLQRLQHRSQQRMLLLLARCAIEGSPPRSPTSWRSTPLTTSWRSVSRSTGWWSRSRGRWARTPPATCGGRSRRTTPHHRRIARQNSDRGGLRPPAPLPQPRRARGGGRRTRQGSGGRSSAVAGAGSRGTAHP
jgi:hypothetical protein